jgi:hypothetical protein
VVPGTLILLPVDLTRISSTVHAQGILQPRETRSDLSSADILNLLDTKLFERPCRHLMRYGLNRGYKSVPVGGLCLDGLGRRAMLVCVLECSAACAEFC